MGIFWTEALTGENLNNGSCSINAYISTSLNRLRTLNQVIMVGATCLIVLPTFGSQFGFMPITLLLSLIGLCNCGPDSILIGAVTADMGNANGLNAGAGVTSLVNGIGSIGGTIEGPLIGMLVTLMGWSIFVPSVLVATILAGLGLLQANSKSDDRQQVVSSEDAESLI